MKKIIAALMTMMLMITLIPGSVAKAEIFKYAGDAAESVAATALQPNLVKAEEDAAKEEGYYEINFPDEEETIIMPIELSDKGGLYLTMGEQDTNYYSLSATLFKDEACTEKVGYSANLFSGDVTDTQDFIIDEAGTYYFKFEASKKRDTGTISFLLQLRLLSGEDQELTKDEVIFSYQDYECPDVTYKIVVDTAGLLTLTLGTDNEYGFSGKVQLLNKDKKALSTATSVYATQNDDGEYGDVEKSYAVAKGTYYVKVDTSRKIYGIMYSFSEVKDSAGTKKDKAKALKLGGSAIKGICTATEKTSNVDWYSFKLTSSKSIVITVGSKLDGKLKVEILDSKGKTLWYGSHTIYEGDEDLVLKSSGKWTKGTFYIKIYKYDNTSSGYYTLKVK